MGSSTKESGAALTLEFLGVGSFFAKSNGNTSFLVNGHILVDCGWTVGSCLHETGRDFSQIDHIFITHSHADHIGGLEECAFYCRYLAGGHKPLLHLPEPLKNSLWEHSLRGGLEDSDSGALTLQDYFQVEVVDAHFEIDGCTFEPIPTNHVPNKFCCGLLIDRRVYYSGDTQFDLEMVLRHGSDATAIFHDCQFPPGGIHASLEELATLTEEIRRKTWLVHYGDNLAAHEAEIRRLGFDIAEAYTPYTFD